jgi:hypothetical protein
MALDPPAGMADHAEVEADARRGHQGVGRLCRSWSRVRPMWRAGARRIRRGPGRPQGRGGRCAAAAHRVVTTELLGWYRSIGDRILRQQHDEGWGTGAVQRLAEDLRAAFPDALGFSRRNIFYRRAMAEAWPDPEVMQQAVAQLPR